MDLNINLYLVIATKIESSKPTLPDVFSFLPKTCTATTEKAISKPEKLSEHPNIVYIHTLYQWLCNTTSKQKKEYTNVFNQN
ncbi:hypothetical protein D0T50_08775 [Bacteroides sp. 214]|nr:hypothetical protein [Bacteroides sp. 214]